jgi:hypothetical protein
MRLLLLMLREGDERYEQAAVRWLGLFFADHPTIGLDLARQALAGLRRFPVTQACRAHDWRSSCVPLER